MKYDVFFSISQTPVDGYMPSESEMFSNFFHQVEAADAFGYETAWIAESHLSSEVQKSNSNPVIPHWQGEVGLNVDWLQLSSRIFHRTKRIETGSAIMNILCNGGPVAAAEKVAAFLALHGLDPKESRQIHCGFAAGRFDFMNRAYGIGPRNELETAAWGAVKGQLFLNAGTIFCRLLRGDVISSADIAPIVLERSHFRSEEDWARVRDIAGSDTIDIPSFFEFEPLKIVPQDFRRDLLQLIIGSHDPTTQERVNTVCPVKVFNLSITRADVIDDTHRRLTAAFHPDGGLWKREYMPRTTFVFINEQPGLSPEQRRRAAGEEARAALGHYWKALQGTIDPAKIEMAATNALIGDAQQIAEQMRERVHPDDRLMLWFDFFNHDNARVIANMEAFMTHVAPLMEA